MQQQARRGLVRLEFLYVPPQLCVRSSVWKHIHRVHAEQIGNHIKDGSLHKRPDFNIVPALLGVGHHQCEPDSIVVQNTGALLDARNNVLARVLALLTQIVPPVRPSSQDNSSRQPLASTQRRCPCG